MKGEEGWVGCIKISISLGWLYNLKDSFNSSSGGKLTFASYYFWELLLFEMMVIDQDVPKSDVESLVVPQSHLGPRRPNTHQSRDTKTTLSALSNTPKKEV